MKLKIPPILSITTTIKVTTANGKKANKTTTMWPFRTREYTSLARRLKAEYETQGKFYAACGVSEGAAGVIGWHPEDADFSVICEGWTAFLACGGEITCCTTITDEEVDAVVFLEKKQ
jgi:hypothetical protein